jgi:hypothetical protein
LKKAILSNFCAKSREIFLKMFKKQNLLVDDAGFRPGGFVILRINRCQKIFEEDYVVVGIVGKKCPEKDKPPRFESYDTLTQF